MSNVGVTMVMPTVSPIDLQHIGYLRPHSNPPGALGSGL
jgi:hypothetical protein